MAISSAWSQGYVTDTLYTDNVFREQGPVWINYVAALKGCVPRPLDRPFGYLELGCGLGHSITIFAAAFPEAHFVGIDFNPAHIDYARRRASELGLSNLIFIEASFQDVAADAAGQGLAKDIGEVDFVAFHGIYSWISAEARAAMQRIIFDRLKSGGLVYNSYNTLPGWSPEVPMQRLAKELALAGTGDSGKRARDAFNKIGELAKLKTGHFAQASNLGRMVENLAKKPGNYLAHEYLNGDWNAFYAPDVVDEMGNAKLDFVGSASLIENEEDLVLTDEARKLLGQQTDSRLRLLIKDFMVNQKFRRDVYVRGHAHLGTREIRQNLARFPLVAAKSLDELKVAIKVPRGTVNVEEGQVTALKAVLSDGAASERDMSEAFGKVGGKTADLSRLLTIFTATGSLMPAARSFRMAPMAKSKQAKAEAAAGQTLPRQRLSLKANEKLMLAALEKGSGVALASQVTGNAVQLAPADVLAMHECLNQAPNAAGLAEKLQVSMGKRGMRVVHEGKQLTEPTAILERLTVQADAFLQTTLPLLRRQGVLESA